MWASILAAGSFIHASTNTYTVKIDDLTRGHYANVYVGARRHPVILPGRRIRSELKTSVHGSAVHARFMFSYTMQFWEGFSNGSGLSGGNQVLSPGAPELPEALAGLPIALPHAPRPVPHQRRQSPYTALRAPQRTGPLTGTGPAGWRALSGQMPIPGACRRRRIPPREPPRDRSSRSRRPPAPQGARRSPRGGCPRRTHCPQPSARRCGSCSPQC